MHCIAYKCAIKTFNIDLNDLSEACNPKCKEGQCCDEGQCFCIDNSNGNPERKLCEGYILATYVPLLPYLYRFLCVLSMLYVCRVRNVGSIKL